MHAPLLLIGGGGRAAAAAAAAAAALDFYSRGDGGGDGDGGGGQKKKTDFQFVCTIYPTLCANPATVFLQSLFLDVFWRSHVAMLPMDFAVLASVVLLFWFPSYHSP